MSKSSLMAWPEVTGQQDEPAGVMWLVKMGYRWTSWLREVRDLCNLRQEYCIGSVRSINVLWNLPKCSWEKGGQLTLPKSHHFLLCHELALYLSQLSPVLSHITRQAFCEHQHGRTDQKGVELCGVSCVMTTKALWWYRSTEPVDFLCSSVSF